MYLVLSQSNFVVLVELHEKNFPASAMSKAKRKRQRPPPGPNATQQTSTEGKPAPKPLSILTPQECERLALNWLDGRRLSSVLPDFNECENRSKMTANELGRQWSQLRSDTLKFSVAYNKVKAQSVSSGDGTSEEQLVDMAKQEFCRQTRAPFQYELAWLAVRDHPKWMATPELHRARSKPTTSPASSKTPAEEKLGSRTPPKLTQVECRQLALTWLDGHRFSHLLPQFNKHKTRANLEAGDLERKWSHLCDNVRRFSVMYNELKARSLSSGEDTPEKQLVVKVKHHFLGQTGLRFQYKSAWAVLHDHPKWMMTMGCDETKSEPHRQPMESPPSKNTSHELAPSRSLEDSSATRSEHKSNIPSTRSKSKIQSADVKLNVVKHTSSALISTSEPCDTLAEPNQTTMNPPSTGSATSKAKPPDLKPSSHKRAFDEVGYEPSDHARLATGGKRMKEMDVGETPGSTVADTAPAEPEDIDWLQLEVRRLEAKMEYERLEMDIMEKDLSMCTDKYEKEFYSYKKQKILARLKAPQQPDQSGGTPLKKSR
jgi:hypothetical protein